MHILHIANSYGGTSVYTNMITALDKLGIRQTVFVPLNPQNHDRVGKKMIGFEVKESKIIYNTNLKGYHKYLYGMKISTIVKAIEKEVDVKSVTLCHAGTLLSDGAVAYELKRKYGIPYISAVRITDLGKYYKKYFWLRGYFRKIVDSASKLVFISPSHKELFLKYNTFAGTNQKKLEVIQNGIDQYFIDNLSHKDEHKGDEFKVVYASAFMERKGLREIIEACKILIDKGYKIKLDGVGEGLPFRKESPEYVEQIKQQEQQYDWLTITRHQPKEEIVKILRSSDIFAMPSKGETFGLVYVEALSQGLPVLYGKNEGFDGYFNDGEIGYAAIPLNVSDTADKLELIIKNYNNILNNISKCDIDKAFCWDVIVKKYFEIYKQWERK